MNIHILIEASHTLGKDHGFWEKEKDLKEEMLYIFSNIGDIAKAYKKGRRANWSKFDAMIGQLENSNDNQNEGTRKIYKEYIKDTFEDEIANVILRITDLFGGKNINIVSVHPWLDNLSETELNYFFRNVNPNHDFKENVSHWLNESLALCMFSSDKDQDYGFSHILFHLGALIEFFDIDIEKHLTKKIEYNRLRPMLYST